LIWVARRSEAVATINGETRWWRQRRRRRIATCVTLDDTLAAAHAATFFGTTFLGNLFAQPRFEVRNALIRIRPTIQEVAIWALVQLWVAGINLLQSRLGRAPAASLFGAAPLGFSLSETPILDLIKLTSFLVSTIPISIILAVAAILNRIFAPAKIANLVSFVSIDNSNERNKKGTNGIELHCRTVSCCVGQVRRRTEMSSNICKQCTPFDPSRAPFLLLFLSLVIH
jgi:hypothetical protein